MALHNSGVDVWIHMITRPAGSWWYVSIRQSPSLCNAIQITAQAFSLYCYGWFNGTIHTAWMAERWLRLAEWDETLSIIGGREKGYGWLDWLRHRTSVVQRKLWLFQWDQKHSMGARKIAVVAEWGRHTTWVAERRAMVDSIGPDTQHGW